MTGIRVNEGTALYWNDIDLTKKRIRIHHMLIMKTERIGNGIHIRKQKMERE